VGALTLGEFVRVWRGVVACVVAVAGVVGASEAQDAVPSGDGLRPPQAAAAVLAREDSIRQYDLPEPIRVNATRVPLLEIIRKAQEGERRKYEGLRTLAYTQMVKVTIEFADRTECHEIAQRMYYRAPDAMREVTIRDDEYILRPDGTREAIDKSAKKDRGVRIDIGTDDTSESRDDVEPASALTNLPDYLERLDRYDFKILSRSIRPDQVVYEIGFAPKSDFDLLPMGRMWILTGRYQVVREEFELQRVPLPGILKSIDLLTREWQEIDGRWVQKRITGRARVRLPGFFKAPKSLEVAVTFGQYAFNPELDPALFGDETK